MAISDERRLADIRNTFRGRTRYEGSHERQDEFLVRLLDAAAAEITALKQHMNDLRGEIELLEAAAAEARRHLETIGHLARRLDGGRTADQMSNDLQWIDDICRRALASPAPQEGTR